MGLFDGITDLIGAATPLAQAIAPFFLPRPGPIFTGQPQPVPILPVGFPQQPQFPSFPTFPQGSVPVDVRLNPAEEVLRGMGVGTGCPDLFRAPNATTRRAIPAFVVPNPSRPNAFVWYKNRGQPVGFSDDFAAVKRVKKLRGRANKALGKA